MDEIARRIALLTGSNHFAGASEVSRLRDLNLGLSAIAAYEASAGPLARIAADQERWQALERARGTYFTALEEERKAREAFMLGRVGVFPGSFQHDIATQMLAANKHQALSAAERFGIGLGHMHPYLSSESLVRLGGFGHFGASSAITDALRHAEQARRELAIGSSHWDDARRLGDMASGVGLTGALSRYAVDPDLLSQRAALIGGGLLAGHWTDPAFATGLAHTSAFANMLSLTGPVTPDVLRARDELCAFGLPGITDTATARMLLDVGGLYAGRFSDLLLPDYGRLRFRPQPTRKAKRAALSKIGKRVAPSVHHIRAYKRIGHTEGLLRLVIGRAMELEYGSSWEDVRLPLCGCNDLLKTTKKRGGTALENADWAHYERIMCDADHFTAIFEIGFADVTVLRDALIACRPERASVAHFRDFTVERLVEVRATCQTLEDGLMEMLFPLGLVDEDED